MSLLEEGRHEREEEAVDGGQRFLTEQDIADGLLQGQVDEEGDKIGGRNRGVGTALMGDDVDRRAVDGKVGESRGFERGAEIVYPALGSGLGSWIQQVWVRGQRRLGQTSTKKSNFSRTRRRAVHARGGYSKHAESAAYSAKVAVD
jgi:hypothetical protein